MIDITQEEFDLLKTSHYTSYHCDFCHKQGEKQKRHIRDINLKTYCSVRCHKRASNNSDEKIKELMEARDMVFIESFYNPWHWVRYRCICGKTKESTWDNFKKFGGKCRSCGLYTGGGKRAGPKHHWYKHGETSIDRGERRLNGTLLSKWRRKILKLFNGCCDICSAKEPVMHAHHLNGYYWDIENRFNEQNGALLCACCHKKFHKIYGKGKNTKEEYLEFKKEETEVKHYDFSDWLPDNQTRVNLNDSPKEGSNPSLETVNAQKTGNSGDSPLSCAKSPQYPSVI